MRSFVGHILCVFYVLAAPPRPSLPHRFSFVANFISSDPLHPFGVQSYWQDSTLKSQRDSTIAQPFNQSRSANYTFLQNHLRGSLVANGVCHGMAAPFINIFAWLELTQYQGTVVIGGKTCDLWSLTQPNMTASMAFYEGAPVLIETDAYQKSMFGPEYSWENMSQTIINFTVAKEPFPDWLFATPDSCFDPDALICSGGTVSNLTIFRFHEPTFKGLLANQDVGDLLGDVFFVCTESIITPQFQWISQFELSVNTSWSSYAACNGDPPHCGSGSTKLVGREAALGLNPNYAGQCDPNDDIGSWYSLPAPAECKGSAPVGPHCAWKELVRVKTINATCLMNHGFVDACKKDGGAPFKQAQTVFVRAFASEDESQGGCPSLHP